jgi:hypothetical protein
VTWDIFKPDVNLILAMQPVSAGLVAFSDPPGVAGDGIPSGGQNPANGAMTYYSADQNGSWLETCTLPAAEKDMCILSLDHFTAAYGSK